MEKTGYVLLIIVLLVWIGAIFMGMISAFPVGLIGIVALLGFGLLFIKVLKERLESKEDDYYSKNIDK
ncbi:MAG: hypothetical protein K9N00_01080 [Candidatus Marinimicrobia bacterium]|nr:hypothetical protein [Candidatus Neomarinimicrobiota bacterium]